MFPAGSLRRNFSWTILGNLVYAACQWGMLASLARLGTPVMLGQFALALAVTAPIMLFANLKLRSVQSTDINDEYAFGSYLSLRLVTIPLALIAIMNIAWLRYDTGLGLMIALMGLAKGIESVSDILLGLLQKHELMTEIAFSQMIKGALSLLFFTLMLLTTGNLASAITGILLAWSSVLLLFDAPLAAAALGNDRQRLPMRPFYQAGLLRPNWSITALQSLAWRTLPLGLAVMLASLGTNIPQYFIEHFKGTYDLGLYAAMSYPLVGGALIINALSQSATPRLAKYYAAQETNEFMNLLAKLMAVGFLLGVSGIGIVALAGEEILDVAYGEEYARQTHVFLWIMVGVGVGYLYVFLGTAVSAMRRFSVQLPIHLAGTILLGTLCATWIPTHGIVGAAWGLVCAGLLQGLLYATVVWRSTSATLQTNHEISPDPYGF